MNRYLAGLVVGVVAAGSVVALDLNHLSLLVIVVALVAGVVTGALAGWRAPQPRAALLAGLLTAAIAGALLAVADLAAGGATNQRGIAVALLGLALCVASGVAVAGLTSAWTGYPGSDVVAAPERAGASGPLGPLPSPA